MQLRMCHFEVISLSILVKKKTWKDEGKTIDQKHLKAERNSIKFVREREIERFSDDFCW